MTAKLRVAVTSDLHYHPQNTVNNGLTPRYMVEIMAAEIKAAQPDALLVAGDVGHGLKRFTECLSLLTGLGIPVGVVGGNHDIWRDKWAGHSSLDLWERLLQETVEGQGAVWLETESMRVGDVVLVGSMAWYDYSAISPEYRVLPETAVAAIKKRFHPDARWIDWARTDEDFAAELGAGLVTRLAAATAPGDVRAALVVTHVPLYEAQLVRKQWNPAWNIGNAFFGNLTLGQQLLSVPKLRAVVSGHTHIGTQANLERDGLPSVEVRVVPSDYQAPAFSLIEV